MSTRFSPRLEPPLGLGVRVGLGLGLGLGSGSGTWSGLADLANPNPNLRP